MDLLQDTRLTTSLILDAPFSRAFFTVLAVAHFATVPDFLVGEAFFDAFTGFFVTFSTFLDTFALGVLLLLTGFAFFVLDFLALAAVVFLVVSALADHFTVAGFFFLAAVSLFLEVAVVVFFVAIEEREEDKEDPCWEERRDDGFVFFVVAEAVRLCAVALCLFLEEWGAVGVVFLVVVSRF